MLIACSESNPTEVNLEEKELTDYLPLSLGNSWTYEFEFYPRASDGLFNWQEGTISWTITNKEENSQSTVYAVDKITNGIEVNYNLYTSKYDTTLISNEEEIVFIRDENEYINLGKGFYNIKVKRYYADTIKYQILDSYYSSPYEPDSNIIHDDYTGHRLKLMKNVGIKEWYIDNRSNSSSEGEMFLKNYRIN
jgi:hypothetical protein